MEAEAREAATKLEAAEKRIAQVENNLKDTENRLEVAKR